MTLMTEEQKGTYLAGLAREKQGYEARLVVVAEGLASIAEDTSDPDEKVRRQQLLNQQEVLQDRVKQVDAEAARVKKLRAKRDEG